MKRAILLISIIAALIVLPTTAIADQPPIGLEQGRRVYYLEPVEYFEGECAKLKTYITYEYADSYLVYFKQFPLADNDAYMNGSWKVKFTIINPETNQRIPLGAYSDGTPTQKLQLKSGVQYEIQLDVCPPNSYEFDGATFRFGFITALEIIDKSGMPSGGSYNQSEGVSIFASLMPVDKPFDWLPIMLIIAIGLGLLVTFVAHRRFFKEDEKDETRGNS